MAFWWVQAHGDVTGTHQPSAGGEGLSGCRRTLGYGEGRSDPRYTGKKDYRVTYMKQKFLMLLPGFVLFGIGCICLFLQHKPREQVVVDRLNEAISNYTEMNIRDDKTYSLKVIDVQMLVTTYLPEYTIFGVSCDEYTVRPNQINEAFTTEQEQDLPICNFEYLLLYDEKEDRFYSVKFEAAGRPVIPDFTEAKELSGTVYELKLPCLDSIDSISLKKNADPLITISARNDMETILNILENTMSTTMSGEIGTPVRVENIINIDFFSGENMIGRLFLYEDNEKYFIEQTGNGVYTISRELYASIESYVPRGDTYGE